MSIALASLAVTTSLVANLPLVVRTYDAVGVSPRTLEQAHASAALALAAAGIRPIWRPCHAAGCISRPKAHELEIRIVNATGLSQRGSLGFATVDIVQHVGTLATVYIDRVDELAIRTGVDRGALLGRAIAHEIGHLILGSTNHAQFGLMRATWTAQELRRSLPLDWMFSARESAEMRRRLSEDVLDLGHEGLLLSSVAVARLGDPLSREEEGGHDGVGERERPRGRQP